MNCTKEVAINQAARPLEWALHLALKHDGKGSPSIKLPVAAMREVGPASQTLGGLLRLSLKETFCSVKKIANSSNLPIATVRKHLTKLHDKGWIQNNGRQPTRKGNARRTCTIKITDKTRDAVKEYCPVPCWSLKTVIGEKWCSIAVWAVIVREWLSVRQGIVETFAQRGDPCNEYCLSPHLDRVGGDGRFSFGLASLCERTGLSRDSVIEAKRILASSKIIQWIPGDGPSSPQALIPNWNVSVPLHLILPAA